jgi:hypothetical protein
MKDKAGGVRLITPAFSVSSPAANQASHRKLAFAWIVNAQRTRFFPLAHNEVISQRTSMRIPIRRLPLILLLSIFSSYSIASPPPPCIKAASSISGQFLVITDISSALAAGVHEAPTLTVYKKERFVNVKDRLTSPGTYWGDTAQWTVVLKPQRTGLMNGCPLSLITDDGELMILLNAESPFDPGLQSCKYTAVGITWAIRYERDRIKVYSLGPSIGENFGQKE